VTTFYGPYSNEPRLCNRESAVYSLSSTPEGLSRVQATVQRQLNPDIFCIQTANCMSIWEIFTIKSSKCFQSV